MALKKSLYEGFAKFFEEPNRENLRDLLKNSVGEIDNIDFKKELPSKTKLSKHLLALANSGGGILIIGVDEDEELIATGLDTLKDEADIQKQVSSYLPESLEYEILDFEFKDSEYESIKDKSFQVFLVESEDKKLPYLSIKSSNEIKENAIYIRRGTNSTIANHEEVQKILNKRIESGYSSSNILDLEEHIDQLKILYKNLSKYNMRSKMAFGLHNFSSIMIDNLYEKEENPNFPEEDFEGFILRAIKLKKLKVLQVLEIDV